MKTNLLLLGVALMVLATGCGKTGDDSQAQPLQAGIELPPMPVVTRSGLWIVDPADGARVDYRPFVTGTISDTTVTEVWVIVRPISGDGYWVQPAAHITPEGAWLCRPYIGLEDTPAGASFTLRAFARTEIELAPGSKLNDWPNAEWVSDSVIVKR